VILLLLFAPITVTPAGSVHVYPFVAPDNDGIEYWYVCPHTPLNGSPVMFPGVFSLPVPIVLQREGLFPEGLPQLLTAITHTLPETNEEVVVTVAVSPVEVIDSPVPVVDQR